jgi:hypothetical protein
MKVFVVVALALVLSGCESMDFFGNADSDAPVTPVADSSAPPPAAASAPQQETMTDTADAADAQAPMTQDAPATVAQASSSARPHCMALARQRAQDAAYGGEDPDTQEAVHDRTYAECMAWESKHAFRR